MASDGLYLGMTIKDVKLGKCKGCGNTALLLPKNNGVCLKCKFPAPPREPVEGSFIEGCECEGCKPKRK